MFFSYIIYTYQFVNFKFVYAKSRNNMMTARFLHVRIDDLLTIYPITGLTRYKNRKYTNVCYV
jgi:hypothetical protein